MVKFFPLIAMMFFLLSFNGISLYIQQENKIGTLISGYDRRVLRIEVNSNLKIIM